MNKKPIKFPLPEHWAEITNEFTALSLGRKINSDVETDIKSELKREVCSLHPLFNVDCDPIAWNTQTRRNFLFATSRSDMPFVSVHFTWHKEESATYPSFYSFDSLEAFAHYEKKFHRKWWQFW